MLDEMGNEMECTESKLDATMKKVAKVLHISNGELLVRFPPGADYTEQIRFISLNGWFSPILYNFCNVVMQFL